MMTVVYRALVARSSANNIPYVYQLLIDAYMQVELQTTHTLTSDLLSYCFEPYVERETQLGILCANNVQPHRLLSSRIIEYS